MRWVNSAGVEVSTSSPSSVSFFCTSGRARTVFSSVPQASMSGADVLAGAKKTYQPRICSLG